MTKKNKVSLERKELAKKLVKEFDIRIAAEAQDFLKKIFAPMLQSMLEGELNDKLGYDRYVDCSQYSRQKNKKES